MALKSVNVSGLRSILASFGKRNISLSPLYLNDSKDDAATKLHNLLQSIIKDDSLSEDKCSVKAAPEIKVPKKQRQRVEKPKDIGKKIVESAEKVANTLPGKPEETEAQLLHKLLFKDKNLTESILGAAAGKKVLMDLLSDMPVEQERKPRLPPREQKSPRSSDFSRAQKVRDVLGRKPPYLPSAAFKPVEKVDLFGEPRLGIFNVEESVDSSASADIPTWNTLLQRELRLLTTHPPSNVWEQMILWTERGILWKFPIDNEIDLEEEKKTDFTEHIYLEAHLESWCPELGPVRQFMEQVCVGLSRNHWLSAKEKKEHILWYKDFFTSKKELLQELGAGEIKESVPQIN